MVPAPNPYFIAAFIASLSAAVFIPLGFLLGYLAFG